MAAKAGGVRQLPPNECGLPEILGLGHRTSPTAHAPFIAPLNPEISVDFRGLQDDYRGAMVTRIKKSSLATRVANKLLSAILLGELKPGQRIYEPQMAKQLDVSAGSFREALRVLAASGIITHKRRATFVAQLTPADASILFMIQTALEPIAAATACDRLAPAHFRTLERLLEQTQRAIARRDLSSFLRLDLRFHSWIWQMSHISTLNRLFELVFPPRYVFLLAWESSRFSENPPEAEAAFRKHIERDLDLLAKLKARDPVMIKHALERITGRNRQAVADLPTEQDPSKIPQPPAGSESPNADLAESGS